MKKFVEKVCCIFLACVLIVCALPLAGIDFKDLATMFKAYAESAEYSYSINHEYRYRFGGILISQYLGNDKNVVVPSEIDGYDVTAIDGFDKSDPNDAFYGYPVYDYSFIETVELPYTVKVIDDRAFADAVNLKSIVLPDGLEEISHGAFYGCTSLEEITLPDFLWTLQEDAFENCAVKEITMGYYLNELDYEEIQKTNVKKVTLNAPEILLDNLHPAGKMAEEIICNGALKEVLVSDNLEAMKQNPGNLTIVCNGGIWLGAYKVLVDMVGLYPHFDDESGAIIFNTVPEESKTEFVSGDFRYYLDENSQAVVSRYLGTDSDVVVPEILDGYTVAEIAPLAFLAENETEYPQFDNRIPRDQIVSISLPSTVQKIGAMSFAFNLNLETINLPEGITRIPAAAFNHCYLLQNVRIPDSVTDIASMAFYYCTNFPEINCPNLEKIGALAFSKSDTISVVTLPETLTSIGVEAFSDCRSLATVVLPDSLAELPNGLFSLCEVLESVILPENLKSVSKECFYGSAIKYIYLPDYVSTIEYEAFGSSDLEEIDLSPMLKRIEDRAFYCCPLKDLTLPTRVEFIGELAFGNTEISDTLSLYGKNLIIGREAFYAIPTERIVIKSSVEKIGINAFQHSKVKDVVFNNGIKTIGRYIFSQCTNIESVTIPESVTYIDEGVFDGCTNIKTIYFNAVDCATGGNAKRPFKSCNPTAVYIGDSVKKLDSYIFAGFSLIESVTIPKSVSSIGTGVFMGWTSLKSIVLPESVKTIGESTFSDCTSLESVSFTSGLESIGKNAFKNCSALTEITIPVNIKTLDLSAFENCTGLKTVYYNATDCEMTGLSETPIEGIYYSPFYTCTALENIIISEKIKAIPDYFFCGLTSLGVVDIPESVTELGKAAFAFCTLTELTGCENLKKAGDYCFYACQGIGAIQLPPGIADIGDYSFAESSITKLFTFAPLESIGDYAFYDCKNLSVISLSEGVMIIGNNAFENCTAVTGVTIPESVKNIGESAFKGCSALAKVKMSSNIVFIPDECFNLCSALSTFEWSVTSKLIGRLAFGNCSSLAAFDFAGIEKLYENSFYKSGIGVVSLGEALDSEAAKLEEIEAGSFMECDNLETVTIGGSISTVKSQSFANCDNLETAMISDNVTDIADDAFDGCENLTIYCSETSYAYSYAQANGIRVSTFVIAAIPNQTYTGYEIKPNVRVSMSGESLTKNIDFTVSFSDNINVGTAKVKVNGSGDYKMFTSSASFSIVTCSIASATLAEISEQAYTGSPVKPTVVLTCNGKLLKKGTDYTVTYKNNVAPGEATVQIKGIGNYSGGVSARFNIAEQSTSDRVMSLIRSIFSAFVAWLGTVFPFI